MTAGTAPRSVWIPSNGIQEWGRPLTVTLQWVVSRGSTALTAVESSPMNDGPRFARDAVQLPPERVGGGKRAKAARARAPAQARLVITPTPDAALPRTTRPTSSSTRSVPVVPKRSRKTRPAHRLPATQPAMFAAWRNPTLRPLVRGSSCTARWSAANEMPMSTVGRPNRKTGSRR